MSYIYKNFKDWVRVNEEEQYYNPTLSNVLWEPHKEDDETVYKLDKSVRKKLLSIAKDFYKKVEDIAKNVPISDIQLTGSLANYNYTRYSDIDIHILIDFSKVEGSASVVKAAFDGIRFIWNTRHNIKIRGHEVELYIQDTREPHTSTGLYSIMNDEWVKKPKHNPPAVNDEDVRSKVDGITTDIENLERKLLGSDHVPSDAKDLYELAVRTKDKIIKMRKESLDRGGEFSVGNLAFKKLRNTGYIGRLIDLISKAYDKIYSEEEKEVIA